MSKKPPFMVEREGSKNLYYKRSVPKTLQAIAGKKQIWETLGTADEIAAKPKYREIDARTDALFADWERELQGKPSIDVEPANNEVVPLTGALSKRIVTRWQTDVIEADFQERGRLWKAVQSDPDAFWRGDVIPFDHCDPLDDFLANGDVRGAFRLVLHWHSQRNLKALKDDYRLGMVSPVEKGLADVLKADSVTLSATSFAALCRRAFAAEIETREQLLKDDVAEAAHVEDAPAPAIAKSASPLPLMSAMVRDYIREALKEKNWSRKDELRWRAMLDEFIEIAGDKPANGYTHNDGADFKSLQLALPAIRNSAEYRKKSAKQCAAIFAKKLASATPEERKKLKSLSPSTIKDKIGCVSRFFEWVRTRDRAAINPLEGVTITRTRRQAKGKGRLPWSIDELNRMFAAPIYTGAKSEREWKTPGDSVLNTTAKYWVPLIALFSGMRPGEIIQLHTADIKTEGGITYMDVTPDGSADDGPNAKSVKTVTSQRQIGVHQTLIRLGFLDFVERQRAAGHARLFPDFEKSRDDDLWSKPFSKYFKRFRDSLTTHDEDGNVTWQLRNRVDFYSLRHNVEDVLRNAPGVSKEVRDAIQGHGESGVGGGYGSGFYIATLNDAVQRIAYPGLQIAHLTP